MTSLRIATWNVCLGAFHKTNLIKYHLSHENLDILFLNETKLNEKHDHELLKISGYHLVTPKNMLNSRIATYIHSNTNYIINKTNLDLVTISISTENFKILGIYRGFKLTNFRNFSGQIKALAREIDDHNVLIGHLNLDYNKEAYQHINSQIFMRLG